MRLSPIRRIMFARGRGRAVEESTPIETGTLDVSASVALTVEVADHRGESP